MDAERRRALRPGGRCHAAGRGAGRDVDADVPRAPRAHVLALSVALHARPHPRVATTTTAARSSCWRGRSCCCASRRRSTRWTPTAASCAGASSAACSSRAPRTAATAACRSTCAAARRSTRDTARVHVEVEVANFYPALASSIARWLYSATQSRIHVIVTHGFLRSLARWTSRGRSSGATPRPTATCPDAGAARRRARRRPRERRADRGRGRAAAPGRARRRARAARRPRAGRHRFAEGYPSPFSLEVMDLLAGPRAAEVGAGFRSWFVVRREDGAVVGEIGYGFDEASATATSATRSSSRAGAAATRPTRCARCSRTCARRACGAHRGHRRRSRTSPAGGSWRRPGWARATSAWTRSTASWSSSPSTGGLCARDRPVGRERRPGRRGASCARGIWRPGTCMLRASAART